MLKLFSFLTTTPLEDALQILKDVFAFVVGMLTELANAIQENIFITIFFAVIVFSLATWAFTKVVRVVRSIVPSGKRK